MTVPTRRRCRRCLGNYLQKVSLPNDTDQQTYRGDQQLGRFGSVFFRWTNANYDNQSVSSVSTPQGNNIFTEESTSWVINHTISLPHNIVNNFRYGRLFATALQGAYPAPTSAVSAFGLAGVFPNLPDYARGYPDISFQNLNSSFGGAGFGSAGNSPTTSNIPLWEIADSMTVVRGKHARLYFPGFHSLLPPPESATATKERRSSNAPSTGKPLCRKSVSCGKALRHHWGKAHPLQAPPRPFSGPSSGRCFAIGFLQVAFADPKFDQRGGFFSKRDA